MVEGERTRIQAYEGVCIGRAGAGLNENFTVRKISYGEGVERVFPLYSPMIDSIKVVRRGKVRRAKLYYLRGRRGKAARITEKQDHRGAAGDRGGEGGRIMRRGWFLAAGLLVASAAVAAAEPLSIEIARAQVGFDQRTNEPVISFRMSEASKRLFADFTTKNVGRKVEIRVDGRVLIGANYQGADPRRHGPARGRLYGRRGQGLGRPPHRSGAPRWKLSAVDGLTAYSSSTVLKSAGRMTSSTSQSSE